MLYPRDTETREVNDLSGIWNFKVDRANEGCQAGWGATCGRKVTLKTGKTCLVDFDKLEGVETN
jgi:hypothetical protein